MTIAELFGTIFWGYIIISLGFSIITDWDTEKVGEALGTLWAFVGLAIMAVVCYFTVSLFLTGLIAFAEIELW